MIRSPIFLAAAALLAGCSNLDRVLENRVADAKTMCEVTPVILQVAPRTGTGT